MKFSSEPIDAAVFDGVLEAGMTTIAAISIVTLDFYNLFGNLVDLLGRTKADDIGDTGISLLLVVCHPESTTNRDIETFKFSVIAGDCNET